MCSGFYSPIKFVTRHVYRGDKKKNVAAKLVRSFTVRRRLIWLEVTRKRGRHRFPVT